MLIINKVFNIYNANGGQIDATATFISEQSAQSACDLLNKQDYGIPNYVPEWSVVYIEHL